MVMTKAHELLVKIIDEIDDDDDPQKLSINHDLYGKLSSLLIQCEVERLQDTDKSKNAIKLLEELVADMTSTSVPIKYVSIAEAVKRINESIKILKQELS